MYSLVFLAAASAAQPAVKWVPLNAPKPKAVEESRASPTLAPQLQAPPPNEQPTTQVPPAPTGGRLDLTCMGAGTASKTAGASMWGFGGSAFLVTKKDRGFNDQVDVRLFSGDDRIRMPRTMLPGIHGGDKGWFKLRNVVADARQIRASAAVGLLNNPKVFIDRVTGTISVSGKSGDYAGQCQAIDASAPAKF